MTENDDKDSLFIVDRPIIDLPHLPPPPFVYRPPETPDLNLVHADDHILLFSKPSGLLSVPGKPREHRDCLETRAQARYPEARLVHRLDMETSGLILMGRGASAHRYLSIGFERRLVEKTYSALVYGRLTPCEGRIDLPLICDWPNRPRQMVDFERGRASTTRWRVLEFQGDRTRVSLMPQTGRSHQLRVHLASLGHPILGDTFYAHEKALAAADRLMLHAEVLSFKHPRDGLRVSFRDPVPF